MNKLIKYKFKVSHDNGSMIIVVYSYSIITAIDKIMAIEECPMSAIKIIL